MFCLYGSRGDLNYITITFLALLLTGCNSLNVTKKIPTDNRYTSQPKELINNTVSDKNAHDVKSQKATSHLTQCNRDLESLRTVSMTEYRGYLAEYDGLMKSSAGFMSVKEDISSEVAEMARPKFQFALVNLCYRIKDALAQTLINQAGGR